MAVVAILFAAISRHLVGMIPARHHYDTERCAHYVGCSKACCPQYIDDHLWHSRGDNIVIMGDAPHLDISHSTAHNICFMVRCLQSVQNTQCSLVGGCFFVCYCFHPNSSLFLMRQAIRNLHTRFRSRKASFARFP